MTAAMCGHLSFHFVHQVALMGRLAMIALNGACITRRSRRMDLPAFIRVLTDTVVQNLKESDTGAPIMSVKLVPTLSCCPGCSNTTCAQQKTSFAHEAASP
jgi:hypothetical protein